MEDKIVLGVLLGFAFTLGVVESANANEDLCFGRNDSAKLDTLIHLIEGIVEIKCARRNSSAPCAPPNPIDCADLKARNASSGVYTIYPNHRLLNSSVNVYCDMDDDGGGWTVIQRRGNYSNPEDYFYRNWTDYKVGFGNVSEDFWLGLDRIFVLTNQRNYQLKFVMNDWNNTMANATYDNFFIENESRNYIFSAGSYNGTAGNSFSNRIGFPFSTADRNNRNCARNYQGAWWYSSDRWCAEVNPNGYYYRALANGNRVGGITWCSFRGDYYSLRDMVMKIRPMPPRSAA